MTVVLIGTDGSDLALHAARTGLALLRCPERIVVATIIPTIDEGQVTGYGMAGRVATPEELDRQSDDEHRAAEAVLAATACALGIRDAEAQVLRGHPGHRLCSFAGQIGADALIVGPRGLGAVKGMLLGSVSNYVVRRAPCPVLTVTADVGGREVGAAPGVGVG